MLIAIWVWQPGRLSKPCSLANKVLKKHPYLCASSPFERWYAHEHFIINSYTTGQQAIFYSLSALIMTSTGSGIIESLPLLIAVSYTFWVFWQFFTEGNRLSNILRSMLTYILYLIFSMYKSKQVHKELVASAECFEGPCTNLSALLGQT